MVQATETTLAKLRDIRPVEVQAGFNTLAGFELMQRAARVLANSTIVPEAYRIYTKDKKNRGAVVENPAGMPNCIVALNMAHRMNADPLMIMQNMHIIEGRPSWSSSFIIAMINACGRYSPLRFDLTTGEKRTVEYMTKEWRDNQRVDVKKTATITDRTCTAWAIERETGERLESPLVTMEMAVVEGWYGKDGSKWQTMPEVMLRYRSAAFFGRLYAPELLMGISTSEEVHDTINIETIEQNVPTITVEDIKTAQIAHDGGSPEEEPAQEENAKQNGPSPFDDTPDHNPETGEVLEPELPPQEPKRAEPVRVQIPLTKAKEPDWSAFTADFEKAIAGAESVVALNALIAMHNGALANLKKASPGMHQALMTAKDARAADLTGKVY